LQNMRGAQLDSYASQLAAAKEAYQARFEQLSAQLREADAKLAEANTILGR
jgi:flagellar capping protein FliD